MVPSSMVHPRSNLILPSWTWFVLVHFDFFIPGSYTMSIVYFLKDMQEPREPLCNSYFFKFKDERRIEGVVRMVEVGAEKDGGCKAMWARWSTHYSQSRSQLLLHSSNWPKLVKCRLAGKSGNNRGKLYFSSIWMTNFHFGILLSHWRDEKSLRYIYTHLFGRHFDSSASASIWFKYSDFLFLKIL